MQVEAYVTITDAEGMSKSYTKELSSMVHANKYVDELSSRSSKTVTVWIEPIVVTQDE